MSIEITSKMIDAGIDANLVNRGTNSDIEDLVSEIYRAMESERQNDRAAQPIDHPAP